MKLGPWDGRGSWTNDSEDLQNRLIGMSLHTFLLSAVKVAAQLHQVTVPVDVRMQALHCLSPLLLFGTM